MKKLIKYFTPVGAEQIAFAIAMLTVTTVILSILFFNLSGTEVFQIYTFAHSEIFLQTYIYRFLRCLYNHVCFEILLLNTILISKTSSIFGWYLLEHQGADLLFFVWDQSRHFFLQSSNCQHCVQFRLQDLFHFSLHLR